MKVLLDAGVLLRFSVKSDPAHQAVSDAILRILKSGGEACYNFQLLREFWNVATRPASANGYGLTPEQALLLVAGFDSLFTFLPDSDGIRDEWMTLVARNKVLGKGCHDAALVAAMRVHGIAQILSLDQRDFTRFGVIVLRP